MLPTETIHGMIPLLPDPPGEKISHQGSRGAPLPPRKAMGVMLSLALAAGSPFNHPPPSPVPDGGGAFYPVRGAPLRRQRRLGLGAADSSSETGSGPPVPSSGGYADRPGRSRCPHQAMATPATHVSTQVRRGSHVCAPPPPRGLASTAWAVAPAVPTPWGHVCAGSAPGTARGRARPPTPGRQLVGASAGPGHPTPQPRRRLVGAAVTYPGHLGAPRPRSRAALGWTPRKG